MHWLVHHFTSDTYQHADHRRASFCHNFAIPNSNVIFLCFALETTGEGSSDGDNTSKKPLTEDEKLQQVKRSESAHQISHIEYYLIVILYHNWCQKYVFKRLSCYFF